VNYVLWTANKNEMRNLKEKIFLPHRFPFWKLSSIAPGKYMLRKRGFLVAMDSSNGDGPVEERLRKGSWQ